MTGGPKPVPVAVAVAVEPRLEPGERVTIRRDSVNGLRILTRDTEAEAEADTLQVSRDWWRPGAELSLVQRLSDIAISATAEFSRFQVAALRTHNVYRARHGVPALTLDTELCRRCSGTYFACFPHKILQPTPERPSTRTTSPSPTPSSTAATRTTARTSTGAGAATPAGSWRAPSPSPAGTTSAPPPLMTTPGEL